MNVYNLKEWFWALIRRICRLWWDRERGQSSSDREWYGDLALKLRRDGKDMAEMINGGMRICYRSCWCSVLNQIQVVLSLICDCTSNQSVFSPLDLISQRVINYLMSPIIFGIVKHFLDSLLIIVNCWISIKDRTRQRIPCWLTQNVLLNDSITFSCYSFTQQESRISRCIHRCSFYKRSFHIS